MNIDAVKPDFDKLLKELFDNRMDLIIPDLSSVGTFPSFAITLEDPDLLGLVVINPEDLIDESPSSACDMLAEGLRELIAAGSDLRAVLICSDSMVRTGSGEAKTQVLACELGHRLGISATMVVPYQVTPGNDVVFAKKVECIDDVSELAKGIFC